MQRFLAQTIESDTKACCSSVNCLTIQTMHNFATNFIKNETKTSIATSAALLGSKGIMKNKNNVWQLET